MSADFKYCATCCMHTLCAEQLGVLIPLFRKLTHQLGYRIEPAEEVRMLNEVVVCAQCAKACHMGCIFERFKFDELPPPPAGAHPFSPAHLEAAGAVCKICTMKGY